MAPNAGPFQVTASQIEVAAPELVQYALAQGFRVGGRSVHLSQGEQDVGGACRDGCRCGNDGAGAVRPVQEALASAALAALGAVFAIHLHHVEGVVDHGRVGDGPANAVGVADRVQVEDVVYVDAARGEDLHVPEAVAVELPADLAHQVQEVAAPVARGVHADGV